MDDDGDVQAQVAVIMGALASRRYRRFVLQHPGLVASKAGFCELGNEILRAVAAHYRCVGEERFERQLEAVLRIIARLPVSAVG
jgi:hypothetical protein